MALGHRIGWGKLAVADVTLPVFDWDKLQKSALFLVPRLVAVGSSIGRRDFSKASHDIADRHKHSGTGWALASSAVTALYDLRPLGHRKCRSAIETFNLIADREHLSARLSEDDIVSCVFFVHDMTTWMTKAEMTAADFDHPDFPRDPVIVDFMCAKARVPLTVGIRIAQRLATRIPDLQLRDFLSCQHDGAPKETLRADGVVRPFEMDDLSPPAGSYPDWTNWSKAKIPSGMPA